MAQPHRCAPFSQRLLADASLEDNLLSLLPASKRTDDDDLECLTATHQSTDIRRWVSEEVDVDRLDDIHEWLWVVGRPMPPRPLHHQRLLNRAIVVTERPDMHLVWTSDRIFLKPLPRFLLDARFWEEYLCRHNVPQADAMHARALGFLFSYAALMMHESDFRIAKETHLIPEELQWAAWRVAVGQLLDVSSIYSCVDRRFHYGELRLSRLNKIYFFWKTPLHGYMSRWNQYDSFFHDNFALLASSTIYIAVVLTAMQVGLATEALQNNEAFQSASYGFTVGRWLPLLLSLLKWKNILMRAATRYVKIQPASSHIQQLSFATVTTERHNGDCFCGLYGADKLSNRDETPDCLPKRQTRVDRMPRGQKGLQRNRVTTLPSSASLGPNLLRMLWQALQSAPTWPTWTPGCPRDRIARGGAKLDVAERSVIDTPNIPRSSYRFVAPFVARLKPGQRNARADGLDIVYDPSENQTTLSPQFEIVAVHSLGAHPEHTWEGKSIYKVKPKVHLLRDLLPRAFPTARILSFSYNSDWLVDAPEKTAQQIGHRLAERLAKRRGEALRLPIIFIGHSFGGIVIKQIVNRESARGFAKDPVSIDTDHAGLNKFNSPAHPGFKAIKTVIEKLRAKPLIQQADDVLINKHYTSAKLMIKRLSGEELPMDQCYINLAIVEQVQAKKPSQDEQEAKDSAPKSSPFSLFARLNVETSSDESQVQLKDLFSQRKRTDGTEISPRRVLIRGCAGVGKTTLCKKIVHEFVGGGMWRDLFDRVLWVPLRNLKERPAPGYNLERFFFDEFFRLQGDCPGKLFAKETEKGVKHDRTLFILDGWDEVNQIATANSDMSRFLCDELLRQPNMIITSRPYASIPVQGQPIDLELETIGFNPTQVDEYIEKTHDKTDVTKVDEIKTFLQRHELVRRLQQQS
ncbi:hypothetical protein COL26b_013263 [Colletotrichum chrysophilum]|uniref:uncharacterized protein n=1 Tax=Colletotrichum chrysophilum TaxID=1836956 RepID=UPI0023019468|nr:uncharacterized protein COL26b_013263 [Colletotrichum chrysophilum]KAJ0362696.1 hypothetical protein COL26b_013263 [Colletotrichum chrysophilum]